MRKVAPQSLSNNRNIWNVVVVSGGAVVGQAALVIVTPVLTRLLSPEELGAYSLFAALVGVFAMIVALEYELAIPLPESDSKSMNVVSLAFWLVLCVSVSVGVVFVAFGDWLLPLFGGGVLKQYVLLIPLSLLCTGAVAVTGSWALRKGIFRLIALAKGLQGIGQAFGQLAGALLGLGVLGLILGQLAGQVSAFACLSRGMKGIGRPWLTTSFGSLWIVAKEYRDFPLVTTWSVLINSLSVQLPVILVATFFGAGPAGLFALGFRVLQMPLRFLGSSISQVYFSMASKAHYARTLPEVTVRVYTALVAFSFPTFVLMAYVSPALFRLVFGLSWQDAGVYTQFLMPWIAMTFITAPLSVLVSVLQRQREELAYQCAYLVAVMCSMCAGYAVKSPSVAMLALGGTGSVILTCKLYWLLKISGSDLRVCGRVMLKESIVTLPAAVVTWTANQLIDDDVFTIVLVTVALAGIHLCNMRLRNVYGLSATQGR